MHVTVQNGCVLGQAGMNENSATKLKPISHA